MTLALHILDTLCYADEKPKEMETFCLEVAEEQGPSRGGPR